ncbi:hypothetical protein [Cryobacterium mannosilyticum]|uniref:Glycosyltransferase family 1 protein n=1 Tax=Cryobacterium mannosilyticum TaxID=1259190 RepID=A0A4R8W3Z2_9MICO|nr:hypothetical protein [Cryobacterium mannosilyticum]TFC01221.1 hypothetical protein E3O32_13755 [Cryobacterium mannosilyticum]
MRIDALLRGSGIRRTSIVFIVNDLYVNNILSLYEELTKDWRFTVSVIACDRIGYDFSPAVSSQEISTLLSRHGIHHDVDLHVDRIRELKPDYLFLSNPYDMFIKEEFHSGELARIGKVLHMSYGTVLIRWEGDYQFLADNQFLLNAYRFFTESAYLFPDDPKFRTIGYLKLDAYQYYGRPHGAFPGFSIAWKPRWTGYADSSLATYIDSFVRIAQDPDVTLNLVLHPNVMVALSRNPDAERISALLDVLFSMPNVNAVSGPDFLDAVLGSDIFVGDVSSTLAEFLSTEKPIVWTNLAGLALNDLGRRLATACYAVDGSDGANSLETVIARVRAGIDPLQASRSGLFERLFEGHPTRSVALRLKSLLLRGA